MCLRCYKGGLAGKIYNDDFSRILPVMSDDDDFEVDDEFDEDLDEIADEGDE
jgi:hypothetical protein